MISLIVVSSRRRLLSYSQAQRRTGRFAEDGSEPSAAARLDQALIRALKARELDVESALTAGMRRRSDGDQLAYATGQARVLCSYNVGDFCRIHRDLMAAGGEHAGLILTQQHRFTLGEHLRRLLRLVAAISAEEMRSRREFLSNW